MNFLAKIHKQQYRENRLRRKIANAQNTKIKKISASHCTNICQSLHENTKENACAMSAQD